MEINKLVASVLVAGLVFMGINVGVDEALHKGTVEATVYPVPEMAAAEGDAAEDPGPSALALLATANTEKGEKLAKRCISCHDLAKGGPNKVGPNLWGIVGDKIAAREGFAYSSALAGLGGEWGYDELDAFLTKPKTFAPGTKMTFAGLKKPADRANILAYLRTLSESPVQLPGE